MAFLLSAVSTTVTCKIKAAFDSHHRNAFGHALGLYPYAELGFQFMFAELANLNPELMEDEDIIQEMVRQEASGHFLPVLAGKSDAFADLWANKGVRLNIINMYFAFPRGSDENKFEKEIFQWLDKKDGKNFQEDLYKRLLALPQDEEIEGIELVTNYVRNMPGTVGYTYMKPIQRNEYPPNQEKKATIPYNAFRRTALVHLRLFNEGYIEKRSHHHRYEVSSRTTCQVWTTWNRTDKEPVTKSKKTKSAMEKLEDKKRAYWRSY
jgi:hypothetical protein